MSLLYSGLGIADGGCAVGAPSPHGVCPDEGLPLGSPPRGLYSHGVADRSLRGENGVAQHEGVALMGDKPHGVAHDFHSFRAVRSGRNHGLRSSTRDEEEEKEKGEVFHGYVCFYSGLKPKSFACQRGTKSFSVVRRELDAEPIVHRFCHAATSTNSSGMAYSLT